MKKLLVLILLLSQLNGMAQTLFDVIITNGRIVDGTGNSWYRADVGIKDGKISAIGHFQNARAKQTIDAQNQIVSPGFIDIHTHAEEGIKEVPTAECFILDGVTSIVTGNCGLSVTNLPQFFSELRQLKISPNIGTFIGHNHVRAAVMKNAFREPTPKEQEQMAAIVEKAMQEGALGLSTGLIYVPGTYSKTPEIVSLAKISAKYHGIYASHIRGETGATVKNAIEEAISIGKEAGLPVEISHFKIGDRSAWGKSIETIALVEKARQEGMDVTIDQYPYTAGSTGLGFVFPSWIFADGDSSLRVRLHTPSIRTKIAAETYELMKKSGFDNNSYVVIANFKADSSYNGKSVTEINRSLRRVDNAATEIELMMDIIDQGGAFCVLHMMSDEDVETILRYPFNAIASDARPGKFGVGTPHPRIYGTYARVLGLYVREKKIIKLEEAIRRMTSLPAQRVQLKDRGLLREGYAADVILFDETKITDKATFEQPHAYSEGISYVLVNGILVVENGKHNGRRPGQILTRTSY